MANDKNKGFVDGWKRAAKALSVVKYQELQKSSYEEEIKIFDSILEYACKKAVLSQTSGLIQMQEIFRRVRN